MSVACRGLHSLYPDWDISPEDPNSQIPRAYRRYFIEAYQIYIIIIIISRTVLVILVRIWLRVLIWPVHSFARVLIIISSFLRNAATR